MKQTVVGVFETSEEARRAQAALLDAQFEPSAVRVSAGGTLRGVDEGMAYPVGSIGAPDAPDLASRGPMPGETPHAHAMHSENALERLADFFRGLFSPESQREELARFEQALARGGALVAIDVNDDVAVVSWVGNDVLDTDRVRPCCKPQPAPDDGKARQ